MDVYRGVGQPRSLAEPSADDIEATATLLEALENQDAYERPDGMEKRTDILNELTVLVGTWISQLAKRQNRPAETHGVLVFPYGGFKIGVMPKGGDIDAVALVPSWVEREEFFQSFFGMLKKHVAVTAMRAVEEAYVPVIKFAFDNVEIDLCLARIKDEAIPQAVNVLDDKIFEGTDAVSIRSLNGCRECDALTDLIPDREVFTKSLQIIKLWAKGRGIHSAPFGYLGGIGWALMTARVCQLYPHAAVSTVVAKFFTTFAHWEWPSPVLLKPLSETDPYKLLPWNPMKNTSDGRHQMPLITPAYPEHNAAFTVCNSTLKIMKKDFLDAAQLMHLISSKRAKWDELFMHKDFFANYKHFLKVQAKSLSKEAHSDWTGLIEARLRMFVQSLEKQSALDVIHPWPKQFQLKNSKSDVYECCWFIGLQFKATGSISLQLADDVKSFNRLIRDLAVERRLYQEGMAVLVQHVKRKQIEDMVVM